jgi:hypothetical protein
VAAVVVKQLVIYCDGHMIMGALVHVMQRQQQLLKRHLKAATTAAAAAAVSTEQLMH